MQTAVKELQETADLWRYWELPRGSQRRPFPFESRSEIHLRQTWDRVQQQVAQISYLAASVRWTRTEAVSDHCDIPTRHHGDFGSDEESEDSI